MRQTRYLILGGVPILLGVVLFLVVNVVYQRAVVSLAAQGQWCDSYDSKIAYAKSLGRRFDFVFLGSSRTMNHINSALLKERGIDALNLGLPSRGLFDQWSPVHQALELSGKYVVISTPASQLFSSRIKFPNRPTFDSLFLFASRYPWSLKDMDMDKILKIFPLNRNKGIVRALNLELSRDDELRSQLDNLFGYGGKGDPRAIRYIRERPSDDGRKPRMVVVYENGDGAVFGSDVEAGLPFKVRDYRHEPLSDDIIDFINQLSSIIREAHLIPVLNLIAYKPGVRFQLDLDAIRKRLPGCIVLDTQPDYPSEWWADAAHLGHDAADAYTESLAGLLKELPNAE